MPLTPLIASPLERFAALAAEYCVLIEGYKRQSPEALMAAVQPAIAGLYTLALALPPLPEPDDPDPDDDELDDVAPPWLEQDSDVLLTDPDRMDHGAWWPLCKSLTVYLGPLNYYREVFDPYEPTSEKEVTGSLADDLADIYRDLLAGCCKWARGERTAAHWEWRFGLENHWGEHATGALRAIHCLAAWHSLPWPPSDGASNHRMKLPGRGRRFATAHGQPAGARVGLVERAAALQLIRGR